MVPEDGATVARGDRYEKIDGTEHRYSSLTTERRANRSRTRWITIRRQLWLLRKFRSHRGWCFPTLGPGRHWRQWWGARNSVTDMG